MVALWNAAALPLLLLCARAAAGETCTSAIAKGDLKIGGASSGAFVMGTGGSASGDKLTIEHNAGFTLFSACEEEWKPESIAQFKLLGQEISFTVDLRQVGCACNLAFYLISMPARGWDGGFNAGDNRDGQPAYYCDANMVGGQWCPEIDIMEANDHAFQVTPHNCESPKNGHYSYCDRGGCSQNTRDMQGSYGPGDSYKIDTTREFRVRTAFLEDAGAFVGMRTTLQQDGRSVVLEHRSCDERYMSQLTDALKQGMSLRITYWGGSAETMAWLDQPPCGYGACEDENAGPATISNITVEKLPKTLPQPRSGGGDHEAPPQKWVSDEWAPWECHHYTGDQQETGWCATAGFKDGYEYKYTSGVGNLCGVCWCCKRTAKLAASGQEQQQWQQPQQQQWAWQAPTTAQPPAPTEAPAPALVKEPLTIVGMPGTWLAGDGASADGDKIRIGHNSGVTIFDAKIEDWDEKHIAEFKLLGKTLSFTVDLSKVGCACNLAFYLISMPARNANGLPNAGTNRGGQPAFYCDANQVGGQWCPEIDIMEANNHAFQATLHRCDAPRHRHYDFCDRGGCAQNTRDTSGAYGPGSQNIIDTARPFVVETAFLATGGVLSRMRTTLKQRGQKVVLEHTSCHEGYLAKLTEAMKDGMSLRITYWGDSAQTMAWMDVPPCDWSGCSGENAGHAVISEISVTDADGAEPTPAELTRDCGDAPCDTADQQERAWHGIVARYVPIGPLALSAGVPMRVLLVAAASGFFGFVSLLAMRRLRQEARRGERSQREGRTFSRAPLVSPGDSPVSGLRGLEGSSPMMRAGRASQLPSPPTGSKLHLLQHLESCIE